jgi:hypothetical protein
MNQKLLVDNLREGVVFTSLFKVQKNIILLTIDQ